jgi:trehalose-6-phosphate synthase
VRENLKQLIAAVKSLCGKSEDAEMEDEIFKLVTKDDDAMRAALAIRGAMDLKQRALDAFKGPITELVQKAFPNAEYIEEDGWYYLGLPVRNGNFWLEVNYLWDKICLEIPDDAEPSSEAEKKALYEVMGKHFNQRSTSNNGRLLWFSEETVWPGFAEDGLYQFHLYKLYAEHPQEFADRIIAIARALESVKA